MLFAYLSLDEVNQALAERFAARRGASLDVLSFRDAAPAGQFDAVFYDLDSLPADRRRAILAELTTNKVAWPVAVHSYSLTRRQAGALRLQGVLVARRLGPGLFARLLQAARGEPVATVLETTSHVLLEGDVP
jgi:hypothetical protein